MSRDRKGRARRSTAARSRRQNLIEKGPLACRLSCERLEDRRLLAVVTVTTVDDTVHLNDGVTSLREAIFATNTVAGADEIRFDPALFAAGARTILLTKGELKITDSLTITGPGAALLTIDASGNDPTPELNNGDGTRAFNLDDGMPGVVLNVALTGLRITGGDVLGRGGGIFSDGTLTLSNCVLANNAASLTGGGLASWGDGLLSVIDTAVVGNSARFGDGGGIHRTGQISLVGSSISGNQALADGGGLYVYSNNTVGEIRDCVITGNSGSRGGGIYWWGAS